MGTVIAILVLGLIGWVGALRDENEWLRSIAFPRPARAHCSACGTELNLPRSTANLGAICERQACQKARATMRALAEGARAARERARTAKAGAADDPQVVLAR
jgi:hypothetical protein